LLHGRNKFLRFIQNRVGHPDVAEDILQSAYARAFSTQAPLRSEESSIAWFYRILRNSIIDYYRHRTVENRLFNPLTPEAETAPTARDRTPTCPCIHGALDDLRPAYKEILNAVDLADDSKGALVNFASKAEITVGNAAVRAHRARHALKEQLIKTCGACAQTGCIDCTCA
jgi:RNA polymerase sigma-70 factor (ECF subfamily)